MVIVETFSRGKIVVAFNERGNRIGETHHNAKIPNQVVDAIRERHEVDGLSYRQIGKEFGIILSMVQKICTYELRAQTPERWKTVMVKSDGKSKRLGRKAD
jgi:hypothetical protein